MQNEDWYDAMELSQKVAYLEARNKRLEKERAQLEGLVIRFADSYHSMLAGDILKLSEGLREG